MTLREGRDGPRLHPKVSGTFKKCPGCGKPRSKSYRFVERGDLYWICDNMKCPTNDDEWGDA